MHGTAPSQDSSEDSIEDSEEDSEENSEDLVEDIWDYTDHSITLQLFPIDSEEHVQSSSDEVSTLPDGWEELVSRWMRYEITLDELLEDLMKLTEDEEN